MIVLPTAEGYYINSEYCYKTLEEVFEVNSLGFWFVDFKEHKQKIADTLINYVDKIEDYGIALHVHSGKNIITIGDFAIKFGQHFENWQQARMLNGNCSTALDTFAADAVNDFINFCGHGNLIIGQKFLNKTFPRKIDARTRRLWNDCKTNTAPFIRVKPGEYKNIYEYDIKGCYRSILAKLPLPSGAALKRPFLGSQFNIYVLDMHDKPEKWGILPFKPFSSVVVGEYTYAALKAQKIPFTVRDKLCYKTSRALFGEFMQTRPEFAEWEAPLNKLQKMKLNSLVGSFGKRETWDEEEHDYKRGYYPVYLAVVDFARTKIAQLVYELLQRGKTVIYANTDSIFTTEPLGDFLNLATAPLLKWTLRNLFIDLKLRGCNSYTGITDDGVVIYKHSGVSR